MRISVEYCDGHFDYVDAERLDGLIRNRSITRFRRSDGWVRVPQGPLRGEGGRKYSGPDRRAR